ncbi:YeaC family protein [Thorsellia kenyensis]|uniref:YeaC family protein n=1 Tax=Thorsellia kenyensis TaxID=1549888 RepID=A0ABV6CAJ8_9GAMM
MNYNTIETILASMTPDIYKRLVEAVETGKWADGVKLTEKQREDTIKLVMLWQSRHNSHADHMSISTSGEIVQESKQALKNKFKEENIEVVVKS